VVPGEVLAGVPPAVLVAPSGEYRHERHALVVSPWASPPDVIGAAAAGAPTETRGLLAVADPPFSRAQAAAMQAGDGAPLPAASPRGVMRAVVRGDRDQLHLLPRLPSTRREVADIASYFGEAEVLLGADASEANLLDQQQDERLGGYDVIHLATHALVDAQRPQRSALVLSQLDPEPDDGLLTAAEIAAGWRLHADLVTLSACETGLGRPTPGDGYLGFTQAFLQAGARNVLVSLWQVDDRATSLLMRRFYENLQRRGLDAAASLAEAQRWLRAYEVRGQAVFADPRDWGAFVLVGSD
jgi:CHAT domain-containing protein